MFKDVRPAVTQKHWAVVLDQSQGLLAGSGSATLVIFGQAVGCGKKKAGPIGPIMY